MQNRFSITRQLAYSVDETRRALDLGLFINGLPIATFELKNKLTKQTVLDAVQQYQRDRDPKELLFQFGRCVVHFAVDDHEVRFCTHLKGKGSWFLPFDKGYNDGAGNPPNPAGLATDYLWKETLSKEGLTDILENYAQVVEEKDEKTGKKRYKQIFPRYHQLKVVRMLLANAAESGIGRRYLIQHSAGSGKTSARVARHGGTLRNVIGMALAVPGCLYMRQIPQAAGSIAIDASRRNVPGTKRCCASTIGAPPTHGHGTPASTWQVPSRASPIAIVAPVGSTRHAPSRP